MKKLPIILLILSSFSACKKDDAVYTWSYKDYYVGSCGGGSTSYGTMKGNTYNNQSISVGLDVSTAAGQGCTKHRLFTAKQ